MAIREIRGLNRPFLDSAALSMLHRQPPDKSVVFVLESSQIPRAVAFGEVMQKACDRRDDRAKFAQPN